MGPTRRITGRTTRLIARARAYSANGVTGAAATALRKAQQMPSVRPGRPDYRRLHYVRYADDFLLGFSGPAAEAEEIKGQIGEFLRDTLKLELSAGKDPDHPRAHGGSRASSATK